MHDGKIINFKIKRNFEKKSVKFKKKFMNRVKMQDDNVQFENVYHIKFMIRQTIRYKNNRNHDKTFSKTFFESTTSSSATIPIKKRKRGNSSFERVIQSKKIFSSGRKTQLKKKVPFKRQLRRIFFSFFIQSINSPKKRKEDEDEKFPNENFLQELLEVSPNNLKKEKRKKRQKKKTIVSTEIKTNLSSVIFFGSDGSSTRITISRKPIRSNMVTEFETDSEKRDRIENKNHFF